MVDIRVTAAAEETTACRRRHEVGKITGEKSLNNRIDLFEKTEISMPDLPVDGDLTAAGNGFEAGLKNVTLNGE